MEKIYSLPLKSSYDLTVRSGAIFLENEFTQIVFGSFEEMLELKLALEESLVNAQKYGLLSFELPTAEAVPNEQPQEEVTN